MKKLLLLIKFLFFLFIIHHSSFIILYGAFEDISVGARATALGGSYTTMCEDIYGIYYNPAALGGIPRAEFGGQYSKLHLGLTDKSDLSNSFTGIVLPVKFKNDYGSVGAGWLRFALENLYQENTFLLSYGKADIWKKLSAGFSAKFLSISYGDDGYVNNAIDNSGQMNLGQKDTLFEKNSKSAIDFDLGLKYLFAKNYAAAVTVQNVAGANISLVNESGVTLDRRVKIGIAHFEKNYVITSDITSESRTSAIRWLCGGERSFDFGGAIRGGLGLGTDGYANFTAGIGYKTDGLTFDYALLWTLTGIKNTYGSHRVSVSMKFGPVVRLAEPDSELAVKLAEEMKARKEIEEKYRISEMELAKAKEEIKQLRDEIERLLKKPAPVTPPKPIPEVKPPVKPEAKPTEVITPEVKPQETIKPEVTPAKPEVTKPQEITDTEQLKAAYIKEFNLYQKNSAKLNLQQRLSIVQKIIATYHNRIKIPEALEEEAILKNELAAQTKFFMDALTYYRRLVKQGISVEERKDILNRMIKKYEALGVDVTAAKEELQQIK